VTETLIFISLVLFAIDSIGLIAVLPGLMFSTLIPGMLVHAWPNHVD
jgi:hypothetical protein